MEYAPNLSPRASSTPPGSVPRARGFASTQWSLVVQAQDPTGPEARQALATLCQTYWYPIYAYIRRQQASADEAEELTQEFLGRFLQAGFFSGAEQARGKFRTYLLACCNHFLANQRRRDRALKRGGGQTTLSLDAQTARQRYLLEPADTLTPEKLFARRWALTLLEGTLNQLGEEYQREDRKALYDELKGRLVGDPSASAYEAAARLGMSETAVKKAAQRLRQRYRAILRKQILATVQSPDEVEDEVRELFAVLGG